MAGGLINLVTYGTQDIYLTGTPQISFFKIVYRRHTNFSVESIEINFDEDVGFDIESSVTIPRIGDLISNMYVKIILPSVGFKRVISTTDVANATINNNTLLAKSLNFAYFTDINSNAYNAAIEIYNAENIIYSGEMVNAIQNVFASYSSDPGFNTIINYFSVNSYSPYIFPIQYNMLLIANNINDPDTLPKDELKKLLDDGMYFEKTIVYELIEQSRVTRSRLDDVSNEYFKFAWVDRLGHSMIDYVDILIGSERIDRHYGDWLNIWYELSGKKKMNDIYMKMIGNIPELTTFNRQIKPSYEIYIPLQFWFNRFYGLALPLVALQYNEVNISIKFKKFSECAYIEDMQNYTDINRKESVNLDDMYNDSNYNIKVSLLIDYIFLDKLERRRFAQSSHEYLIDQLQIMEIDNIEDEILQFRLDFINPCKELIWVLQKNSYIKNINGFIKCRWDNYSINKKNKGNPIDYLSLDFNGYTRIPKQRGNYFNYLQPYQHHSNTPSDGINIYSFSLRPEEHQPTGSCNFSRIPKTQNILWINPSMFFYKDSDYNDENNKETVPKPTDLKLRIYTLNHNVLRIISGYGATAYI